MSARPTGLFIGLCTLDVMQLVERVPDSDEKVAALDVAVAAGGPATNAAVAFAALGGRAVLLTRVGGGAVGALVAADLRDQGVDLVDAADEATAPTTVASILVTQATGERAVVSALDRGRSTRPATAHPHPGLVGELAPDVVIVDSHEIDLSLPLARAAAERGVPVVLDCGARKPWTEQQLPHVTAALVSERYLPDGPDAVVGAVRAGGVPFGAVTAGAGPLTCWDPTGLVSSVPVRTVEAVDTLGAGDFFHGGFAYDVACRGLTVETFPGSLRFASEVAALSVQSFGSRAWLPGLAGLPRP